MARYFGAAPVVEENRNAVSTPGTASRSGTCSVSYHALNSSSIVIGGCIRTSKKPFCAMRNFFWKLSVDRLMTNV
jgi:hypothetical protein